VDKGICDWEESVDCSFLVEMIDVGGVGDENGESDTTTAASSGGGEPFNESGVHAKSSPQQATTLNSEEVVNINTESLIQPIEETGSTESMQSTKEASTEFQQKKTAHNKSIIGYLSLKRGIQVVSPESIAYDQITRINLGCFYVTVDGRILIGDSSSSSGGEGGGNRDGGMNSTKATSTDEEVLTMLFGPISNTLEEGVDTKLVCGLVSKEDG
jgi:hypothetical protein